MGGVSDGEFAIQQIPRIVKPRKTGYTHYPLLAVRNGQCLTERGLIGDVNRVDWRKLNPVMVVGVNIPLLVAELDERYCDDPGWQWRGRDASVDIGTIAKQQRTIIDFFGFKADRTKGHYTNRYHYCIDAFSFYSNSYTLTDEDITLKGLMKWALTIREFCQQENLAMRATTSGIAAQYLRDPRFYGKPRRKVPKAINARVREHLPGNHYQLSNTTPASVGIKAIEIDQQRAHHYHAENTPLPDADTLFAIGDFQELKHATTGYPRTDFHGLYFLRVSIPRGGHPKWSPIRGQGNEAGGAESCRFIYSCEMPMLRDLGYRFGAVVAAWGSRTADNGIPLYARHCQQQLDKHNDAPWLKPLLLTTYGLLAVKPRVPALVYKQAEAGERFELFTGSRRTLAGILTAHTKGREIEPGIANVLHRGLIEAATRAESLGFASALEWQGHNVIQVYADSVIIEDDPDRAPPPILLPPWRIKSHLTDYRPLNPQAFISVEKTRLPGVGRDSALRAALGTVGQAPIKRRTEALTGRSISAAEQRKRGLALRRI